MNGINNGRMKKTVSILLALTLCMSLCLFSTNVSATSLGVQNFNTIAGTDVTVGSNGGAVASLSSVIRITAGAPTVVGGVTTKAFGSFNFMPETTCFDGQTGLMMYVENPNNVEVAFQVMFDALGSNNAYLRYYLYSGGDLQPLYDSNHHQISGGGIIYSSIVLPVGYKGTICLPFSGFFGNGTTPATEGELGMVMQMTIGMNCSVAQGQSVCIGDMKLYPNLSVNTVPVLDYNQITNETFGFVAGAYSAGYGNTAAPIASISLTPNGYNGTNGLSISGTAHASLVTVAAIASASGANGLRFYAKNLDPVNTQMFFVQFDDPNGERWIATGKNAVFTNLSGGTFPYPCYMLPAGFEGFVYIPFDCFESRNFSATGVDDFSNSNIGVFILELSPSACTNFIVDEFSLVKNTNPYVLSCSNWPVSMNAQGFVAATDAEMFAAVERRLIIDVQTTSSQTNTEGVVSFPPRISDWSEGRGIVYDISNQAASQVKASYTFTANGIAYTANPNAYARFSSKSGVETMDSAAAVPANFNGTVTIPFESFNGYTSASNLTNITGTGFVVDGTDAPACLIVDNIALIDTAIVLPAPPASNVIENFNLWTSAGTHIASSYGDPIGTSLDTSIAGHYNLMKYDITGTDTNPLGIGNTGFVPYRTDWSGGNGVQLFIKNSNASEISLRFIFQEANGNELWVPKSEAPYYLKNGSEEPVQGEIIYQTIRIPANFEGIVQLPFTSFNATVQGLMVDNVQQLGNISQVIMEFDSVTNRGKSILIDDIQLINTFLMQEQQTTNNMKLPLIESFENWTPTTLDARLSMWADGSPITAGLVSNGQNGSTGLEFTIGPAVGNGVGVIIMNGTTGDWNSYKGIKMFIRNPSGKSMAFRFQIEENAGTKERFSVVSNKIVTLINQEGIVQNTATLYDSIIIPANFSGQVEIPFAAFKTVWWDTNGNGQLELASMGNLYFEFDNNVYAGQKMIVDNIALFKNSGEVNGIDNVQTGDSEPHALIVILLLSCAGIVFALFDKKFRSDAV